ncbi:Putative cullin-like protein 2 [Zea mays]|uniref:Putative cullin-like protein 2 n=1 Tax=Zea mays TaxID=4577 RepID=A0A1D6N237_MAIZE|nr:Putative cullin-like protein 2 [Zea mays]
MNNHLSFEEGWKVLEQGIVKCSKILECTSTRPTVNEYMNYYDCAYRMAVQKQHYCPEMYNGFKMMLAECVRTMVLPHLMHKQNDSFFRELVKMWSNYCIMIRCVIGFFSYLDRCYVKQYKLPSLSNTAATSFFDPVFSYFNDEARTALLTMLVDTADYGVLQVEESMEMETKRLAYYLEISSGDSYPLCLQAVNAPLMETYVSYVTEKQIGGQLMLETYKIVEEELLGRCSSLTLG